MDIGSASPVFVLTVPRSHSSVVTTMVGRHPQLYGFPELHFFHLEAMGEALHPVDPIARFGTRAGTVGLLRTLAQLHEGTQTTASLDRAREWLEERRDWPPQRLYDYLFTSVWPAAPVLKIASDNWFDRVLDRYRGAYPAARYVHLVRHPVTTQASMQQFFARDLPPDADAPLPQLMAERWLKGHLRILRFLQSVAPQQTYRLRAEDVLSAPYATLPPLAAWLGVRADAEAVDEMTHPERSPYAGSGPRGYFFGANDPKFEQDPQVRPPRREPAGREQPPAWGVEAPLSEATARLAERFGY